MTSWRGFVFQSAPWPWKILSALTMPFWAPRAKATWPFSGGWEQKYGRCHALGVKPPRLMQLADSSIGDQIFIRDTDVNDKVRSAVCHELTHAFTADLLLPAWLKEGVAMVAVDRFFGRPTVKRETLLTLERLSDRFRSGRGRKLRVQDREAFLYTYVRGYCLTRYLEETQPDLVTERLSRRHPRGVLEERIAASYRQSPAEYWDGIDKTLITHFQLYAD